jgi:hypothetical protein
VVYCPKGLVRGRTARQERVIELALQLSPSNFSYHGRPRRNSRLDHGQLQQGLVLTFIRSAISLLLRPSSKCTNASLALREVKLLGDFGPRDQAGESSFDVGRLCGGKWGLCYSSLLFFVVNK